MLLKLLLISGVIKCRCRFVYVWSSEGFDDWYYDPNKGHTLSCVPDCWLNRVVSEITPSEFGLNIYVE